MFISVLSSIRLVTTPFTVASSRKLISAQLYPKPSTWPSIHLHPHTNFYLSFLHRWTCFSLRTITLAILNRYAASQLFTQNITKPIIEINNIHNALYDIHIIYIYTCACIYIHIHIYIYLYSLKRWLTK